MFLSDLKNEIRKKVNSIEPNLGDRLDFSYPPSPEFGHLSASCFNIAKSLDSSPAEISQRFATELKIEPLEVRAVGPYVNFFLSPEYAAEKVIKEVKKLGAAYGANQGGGGKGVMIEYSNGNTHKEYHVGHLRNIAYGDAVSRLLAANGFKSIPVSYINDFGIHIAKTIWNWQRNPNYAERPEPKGYLLGKCYTEASRELEKNPEAKEEVGKIMTEIESRCGESYEFWEESRQWSIDYFSSIYKELGVKFEHIFYENEEIAAGLKLVQELLTKGILRKSEGAIIADLEKYGLGVLPIIRSDGTALYPVADLALASEKFKQYDLYESIYVVDVRQSLYFKQLFKILELMGYKQPLVHLSYDFVTLPEGMMASRTGNVITYQDLKDKLLEKLTAETKKRHIDWTDGRVAQVAGELALATMKFEMLKVGAEKIITFNLEEAAKFDGYTACYLEYSYARLKSIVRKEGFNLLSLFGEPDWKKLTEKSENNLIIKLARYPEIVAAAGAKYNPSEIAKYLFELAQMSNDYYHGVNILKAAGPVRRARIILVKAVAQVLKNGLEILGIRALEEM
ncbi:MAG: arginine--tRNA ligase [Patescibacteria group bacterium]